MTIIDTGRRSERWSIGATNLAREELAAWTRTRRWWTQLLLWTALTNGLLAGILWVLPNVEGADAAVTDLQGSALQFFDMGALLLAVGVIMLMQGSILDERRSGSLEWVLSKPVTRTAVLLAKLAVNVTTSVVVMIVVPWTGVYLQLSLATDGGAWPLGPYLAGLAILVLYVIFTATFVLALSVLTDARGIVVGLPLLLAVGYQFILVVAPAIEELLPWTLGFHAGGFAAELAEPGSGPVVPILVTTVATLALGTLAVVRFRREEL